MITPGQTLENPVTGERFTFTDTAASSNGELLGFDFALPAGAAVPIPHVHPIQTERFEVREGLMRFRTGLPRNLLDLAELARRYDQEAHAPLLSIGIQRLLLAPLLRSARSPRTHLNAALRTPRA